MVFGHGGLPEPVARVRAAPRQTSPRSCLALTAPVHLLERHPSAIVTGSRDMGRDITRSYLRSTGRRSSGNQMCSCPHTQRGPARPKPQGSVDILPSGSLRVRVYAGTDVLTGQPHYVAEVIKLGPHAQEQAEEARHRLVDQVQTDHHVKTNASVVQLIEEHLKTAEVEETTKDAYRANLRKHIKPQFKAGPAAEITAHTIEKFKAELRRCREHCDGRPRVDHRKSREHRKSGEHACTAKCRRHVCKPLAKATVRKILFLISAAYHSAITWGWLHYNPVEDVRMPAAPPPDPQPPTAEEAARIMTAAWRVPGYLGPLVWLAMTIGARRGELCGLRWKHLQARHHISGDHDCQSTGCEWWLAIRASRAESSAGEYDKDTKTHQTRRVALDLTTVAILTDFRRHRETIAKAAGRPLVDDAYLFAASIDGSVPLKPTTVTQRYRRLVTQLGITTSIKMLRHYSATELLTAGVDLRTVAGRLGHGGGGTTTLKVYAAFVSAADQRAALIMLNRMPAWPVPGGPIGGGFVASDQPDELGPQRGYEVIAADIRTAILDGTLPDGSELATVKDLAAQYNTTVYQAHRAMHVVKRWGLLTGGGRGKRLTIVRPVVEDRPDERAANEPAAQHPTAVETDEPIADSTGPAPEALDIELFHLGQSVRTYRTQADPTNANELLQLLLDTVRRTGGNAANVRDYELVVRYTGERSVVTTFIAPPSVVRGFPG
jgi:integrase